MKTKCLLLTVFSFLTLSGWNFAISQTVTITVLNPVCNNNGILVATATGGPFLSYNWYTNDGPVVHNSTALTDTLYNFKGGTVYLAVISANGGPNANTSGFFPYAFNITTTVQPDTCPLQTGAIALNVTGGTGALTYSWTFNGFPFGGNTPSLTNLNGGDYDCLITDIAGCQMYLSDMDVDSGGFNTNNVPSINTMTLSVTTTPANCTNGTATVVASGGLAPYSYLWNGGQTTATITGLSPDIPYGVYVTDANNCVQTAGIYIQSSVSINLNQNITPSHCTFSDGAVILTPTGGTAPYAFLWNTLATTNSILNVTGGTYMVTVSDAQGCIQNSYINVPALTPVNVNLTSTPSQCLGTTGTVTANVSGGISPYSYEWFTTPIQTTQTATGVGQGSYNFRVTDSQGCTQTGLATVQQNSTLAMLVNTTPSVCTQNNGTADMVISGGVAPFTYLWSNGQTTPSISNLAPSLMFGTVTDNLGCFITNCKNVQYSSPLFFTFNEQWCSCIYTPDGSISVNITNGTAPFTYDWSNGMTTPSISGLLPGRYYLTVTDANGCMRYSYVDLGYNSITPCTSTLQGRVFVDLNSNCNYDAGEMTLSNIPMYCSTIDEFTVTDLNGIYTFQVPVGMVSIEQLPLAYRYQQCPSSNPFTINIPTTGVIIVQDIADSIDYVNDLSIRIWHYSSPPVVGFSFYQRVVEFNLGTQPLFTTSQYDYDSQAPFGFSTISPTTFNPGINQCSWDNLVAFPLDYREYDVFHSVPASVPINTPLYYTDSIFPIAGDTTWWDNTVFKIANTVGSYDPNYKEVTPKGIGAPGYISLSDSVLEYVVHFQNIGNYYATNIKILDQLDDDLDPLSLRVLYSTHTHSTRINSAGLLEFQFDYIMLPSIEQDSVLSNGFVVYTIKQKPNLPDGTEITNSADIYFDFNAPITTNTTLNTIQITGIDEYYSEGSLVVYPNPNNGNFTIGFYGERNETVEINLNSINGQIVFSKKEIITRNQKLDIHTNKLAKGIYVLQVIGDGIVEYRRVVVE